MRIVGWLNHEQTALAAIAIGALTVISSEKVQNAIVEVITHPDPATIVPLVGAIATAALFYVARPVGLPQPKVEPQPPKQNPGGGGS